LIAKLLLKYYVSIIHVAYSCTTGGCL